MVNPRRPGGLDEPTQDPERARQRRDGTSPAPATPTPTPPTPPPSPRAEPARSQPWVDSRRTLPLAARRGSIADRVREASPSADPLSNEPPGIQPDAPATMRQPQVMLGGTRRRAWRGWHLAGLFAGVVVVGMAAGATAAWFSGWRPGFLMQESAEPEPPPADKPDPKPPGPKPRDGDPAPPPGAPEPRGEVTRACITGQNEVKGGAGACGFTLDATGAVAFQGNRLVDRLDAGSGPARRLILYPFSPSGRFVFLKACDAESAGRCPTQRLVDTKERKLFEVRSGSEGFRWVAWSPKERHGLVGYRDGIGDTVAIIATADGKVVTASAVRTRANRYALVRQGSLRWPSDDAFSVEVKLCPYKRGRTRNADCEQDSDIRYRRRKIEVKN